MGEIADDMIDGFVCQQCGVYLDGITPGYPLIIGAYDE